KLFPRGKEETFVLQNWTAHISTPAVEVKARVSVIAGATVADNSRVLLQGVEGVQFSILQELVYPAVKIVSAALGHGNKLAARRMAVLGRELILQQREFRHRFGGDIDLRPGNYLVVIVHAIDHEIVIAGALPADRTTGAHTHAAAAGDVGGQQSQVVDARRGPEQNSQSGLGQVHRLPVVEGFRKRGRRGLDQLTAGRRDGDRLSRAPDSQ